MKSDMGISFGIELFEQKQTGNTDDDSEYLLDAEAFLVKQEAYKDQYAGEGDVCHQRSPVHGPACPVDMNITEFQRDHAESQSERCPVEL